MEDINYDDVSYGGQQLGTKINDALKEYDSITKIMRGKNKGLNISLNKDYPYKTPLKFNNYKYTMIVNNEIKDILDIKIKMGIFNKNCKNKINIQQIKDDEIFTFNKFNYSVNIVKPLIFSLISFIYLSKVSKFSQFPKYLS